jgi:diadenosine tetraphosphate (Ap4A) HIT family hydrolase
MVYMNPTVDCPLCDQIGGHLLWQDDRCRVVRVDEPGYSAYCRVIWHTHVAEMTDLNPLDQTHCLRVVLTVESVLRALIKPDKINLASLGNFTPHLHWHVVARFQGDPHFPQSVWGPALRPSLPFALPLQSLSPEAFHQTFVRLWSRVNLS